MGFDGIRVSVKGKLEHCSLENAIKTLYLRGRHQQIVAELMAHNEAGVAHADGRYVAASLAILGQVGEAELLMAKLDEQDADALVFVRAHLAYASVNSGRYDRARRYLGLASRLRDATSEAEALFFLYFGFAYYRFATGRLSPAVASIHRAGAFLKKSGPSYPVAIWSELRGHLAVLTGDVEAGLGHLAAAADYFTSLGREDLAQKCETARALYAARYLLRAKEGRAVLRQCLTRLSDRDFYGRASVWLELTRQAALTRRISEGREALAAAGREAVAFRSRRYEVTAGLRYVDLLLADGAINEALIVLRGLERALDPDADGLVFVDLWSRLQQALSLSQSKELRADLAGCLRTELDAAAATLARWERRTGYVRPAEPKAALRPRHQGLNCRQVRLLSDLGDAGVIDVQTYRQTYHVTEITACRDLAGLTRLGHLERLGKARATRYRRPMPEGPSKNQRAKR